MVIVEIPQYIRKVKFSEKQREQYYEWNGKTIKAKGKEVPKSFLSEEGKKNVVLREGNVLCSDLKLDYALGTFINNKLQFIYTPDDKIYKPESKALEQCNTICLIDINTQQKIVANPTKAGTPKYEIIRGQDFYNSAIREHSRGTIMQAIKNSFVSYVKDIDIINDYPIRIKCYLYDTVMNAFDPTKDKTKAGGRWDVGNRCYPYSKAFLDLLATGSNGEQKLFEPKIKDDDRLHVTEDPQGGIFCPIDDTNNRKLVFVIAKDDEFFQSKISVYENERLELIKKCKHYGTR